MCVNIYVYIYTFTCTYLCVNIHMHVHRYMHANIYAYIYMRVCRCSPKSVCHLAIYGGKNIYADKHHTASVCKCVHDGVCV